MCLVVFVAAIHAVHLAIAGHLLMAGIMTSLAAVIPFAQRQMLPQDAAAPRRLLLSADGRMHVACIGGAVEQVELAGESLWLGSAVLLVLRAGMRKHRVLLGRGNLDPAALSTLRRRLQGAAIAAEGAVDSSAIRKQGASVVEQVTRANAA